MPSPNMGPDFDRCALIIVDMQNDFVHADGSFAHRAREHPEAAIDLPFLTGTIPHVRRLADAIRAAGRPVVYVAHILKPDYSDAAFPYWRIGITPGAGNRTHCVEGTWGAQIIDELKPRDGDYLVVKKGFGGFANTPLDTILRNMGVNTCVVSGVTTCVCVSNTVRGGSNRIIVWSSRRRASPKPTGRRMSETLPRCKDCLLMSRRWMR